MPARLRSLEIGSPLALAIRGGGVGAIKASQKRVVVTTVSVTQTLFFPPAAG